MMTRRTQRRTMSAIKHFYLVLLTLCLSLAFIPTPLVFADSGNKLYITPNNSQMNVNSIFTIQVGSYAENAVTNGSVSGTLNFTSGRLQVIDVSVSGSGYASPSITQNSASIGFTASRSPAPSGIAKIFSVTFKAKAAGKATVSFSNASVNGTAASSTGGSFDITSPKPPSTPKPSTKPKPSKKPSPSTPVTPAPPPSTPPATPTQPNPNSNVTPDPTGLIDSVVVTPSYASATINWRINASNPTSSISYGPSLSQLDKRGVVKKTEDGLFTTTITDLTPGLRYSFTITGDGSRVSAGSYSGTIATQGFPVVISMTENNVPIKSAQLKIGSQTHPVTSDRVTLGLAAGSYTGTIITDTASLAINLTVEAKPIPTDGSAPEAQSFTFNLTSSPIEGGPGSGMSIFVFIGVLIGGTAILGLAFFVFINIRRHRFESDSYSHISNSTVIVEDGYDWHSDEAQQSQTQPPVSQSPAPESTRENYPSESTTHVNSVYLTEEEPLDMFEQSRIALPPTSHDQTPPSPDVMPQNPNPPHSTTP